MSFFLYFYKMNTISDLLKNAIFVKDNLAKEIVLIKEKNKQKIIDFNIENQLFKQGIDSLGNKLKPYSKSTIQYKKSKGQPYNRRTLFDTGTFTNLFEINSNNQIFSKDSKTSKIQDREGSSIFGLTDENNKKVNYEIFKPQIQEFINKYL